MHRLIVNPNEANQIRDAHVPLVGSNANQEESLIAIREAAAASLSGRLAVELRAIRTRNHSSSCLIIQRIIDLTGLPPTPIEPNIIPKTRFTLLSEVIQLGIALTLGEPIAYKAEKNGALVQHVFPIRSEREAPSNESSASMLDLHTELVFSRRQPKRPLHVDSPDFILLLCLRSDPKHEAATLLAEIESLCSKITPSHLSVLSQPRFELRAPYSFTRDDPKSRPWVGPVSVLGDPAIRPTAAFDLACGTRGLDVEARQALDALREAALMPGVISRIRLKAGDLVILDNRRCVHGRTPFLATYDGHDRWIQRVYVRLSLENMQPLDRKDSPRIF